MLDQVKALWTRMIERADADSLPESHPLRLRAKEFQESVENPDVTARTMLGRWARARRVWCEYTGEALL